MSDKRLVCISSFVKIDSTSFVLEEEGSSSSPFVAKLPRAKPRNFEPFYVPRSNRSGKRKRMYRFGAKQLFISREQPVATVRASVLIYDDARKRWLPAGDTRQQIESKVQLFRHMRNGCYRVVARQIHDQEAVLNCSLYPSMKYNVSTPTFHQWRSEQRRLYGLNFLTPEDADNFGHAVLSAVQELTRGDQNFIDAPPPVLDMPKTPTTPSRNAFATSKSLSVGNYKSQTDVVVPCTSSIQQFTIADPRSPSTHLSVSTDKPRRQNTMKHINRTASTAGDYASQRYYQQRRMQEDESSQTYETHKRSTCHTPLIQKHQQQCPASVQQHRRRLSAGSSGSNSSNGVGGGLLSTATQTSNLIFSTVTPVAVAAHPPPSCGNASTQTGVPPAPPLPPPPTPSSCTPSGSLTLRSPSNQQQQQQQQLQKSSSKIQMQNMVCAGVPPPPPPPPPPPGNETNGGGQKPINLAQAITNAKLRKVTPNSSATGGIGGRSIDESTAAPKDARSKSVGSVESSLTRAATSSATLASSGGGGGGGGHSNVISEMAATLARRRMIVESAAQVSDATAPAMNESPARIGNSDRGDPKHRVWDTRNGSRPSVNDYPSSANIDSPKTHRKMPSGSSLSSQEDGALSLASNGNGNGRRCVTNGATTSSVLVSSDNLEQWKQEIMNEVRRELTKAKSDIIDALRMELSRR